MAEQQVALEIGRLVAEHYAAVYGYAFRLSGSVQDAEDLTQQTFLAAQHSLGQLRNVEGVRGWLYAILRNCFLKNCQRWQPTPVASLQLNLDTIPEEDAGQQEIDQERLQEALNQLPSDFRTVLTMFYFEGCSYRQIAQSLDLPIGTVMSRLARAKGHLRAKLLEVECPAAREP
jgi:RNA polymerase sigma-70 factor, ECF subfamily